jgi:hypothetical protein
MEWDENDKSKEGQIPQTADKRKFKVIARDEFKPDGAVTKGYILDQSRKQEEAEVRGALKLLFS